MCGIFLTNNKVNFTDDFIKDELSKRGDDSFNEIKFENLRFFHSRLSITGDDASGLQPVENEDYILMFNGQIYNYKDLARTFNVEISENLSDTFVLNRIVEKHINYGKLNSNFTKLLSGFYVIVVFIKKSNEIYIIRDNIGKKPLYYRHDDESFSCSSRATLLINDKKTSFNIHKILNYLYFGEGLTSVDHWFRNVNVLLPGQCIRYNYQSNVLQFSSIDAYSEYDESLSDCISNCIDKRLICSDKRKIISASSGVDSTTLLKRAISFNPKFNSVTYAQKPYFKSELPLLQEKVKVPNDQIHKVCLDEKSVHKIFKESIDALEVGHSSTAIIPYMVICKYVRSLGYKILIEGQGADELFLGYDRYLLHASFRNILKFKFIVSFLQLNTYRRLYGYMKLLLESLRIIFPFLISVQIIRWKAHKLIKLPLLFKSKYILNNIYCTESIFRKSELKINLVNLLTYGDCISLYNGIESRNPFCDSDLRNKVLDHLDFSDLVGTNQTKKPLRYYSKKFCNIDQKMERKIGFFNNSVSLLKKTKGFTPVDLRSFFINISIFKERVSISVISKLPDNIYFRFICLKAVIENLNQKDISVTL